RRDPGRDPADQAAQASRVERAAAGDRAHLRPSAAGDRYPCATDPARRAPRLLRLLHPRARWPPRRAARFSRRPRNRNPDPLPRADPPAAVGGVPRVPQGRPAHYRALRRRGALDPHVSGAHRRADRSRDDLDPRVRQEPLTTRTVKAVHGVQQVAPDPADEVAESARLRERESREALLESYAAAAYLDSADGARQRRVLLRALCKSFGNSVRIGVGVLVLHPHTFDIGDAVFVGNQTSLQAGHDGHCPFGRHTGFGPRSNFTGRDSDSGESWVWGRAAKWSGGG